MYQSIRLNFIPFSETEEKDYLDLVGSSDVMMYISGHGYNAIAGKKRFEKVLRKNEEQAFPAYFCVSLMSSNEFVGLGKFYRIEQDTVEIGYSLKKKFWNQRYGSEVANKMIDIGRNYEQIKSYIAMVDPDNLPSIKILTKLGFGYEKDIVVGGLPGQQFRLIK